MEKFPKFTAQERDAATPGVSFCGFMRGGTLHLGFVIVHDNGSRFFISISPGVSAFGNRPGITSADDASTLMIYFDKARIRLPFGPDAARTGKSAEEIAGAIVLVGGKLGVAALVHPKEGEIEGEIVDLTSGKAMMGDHKKDFHPYFPSWAVETRDDDGTWRTLRDFNIEV